MKIILKAVYIGVGTDTRPYNMFPKIKKIIFYRYDYDKITK